MDPDLKAMKNFYASAIVKEDLDSPPYRASLMYDLSLVPEHMREAVRREMENAWRNTMARVQEHQEYSKERHVSPGQMIRSPIQRETYRSTGRGVDGAINWSKEKRDEVTREVLGMKPSTREALEKLVESNTMSPTFNKIARDILNATSGPSPSTPGTTSTSTPESKEPSSSSTSSESSDQEPGPSPF